MARINMAKHEITMKVVYYGAAYSGKTTNLTYLHQHWRAGTVSELFWQDSEGEHTLQFDLLLPGSSHGLTTRLRLCTVPGEVPKPQRLRVLQELDALVFVVDSSAARLESNRESLAELREHLGDRPRSFRSVIQWNKRDRLDALPVEVLDQTLNPWHVPSVEASALQGQGVVETLEIWKGW